MVALQERTPPVDLDSEFLIDLIRVPVRDLFVDTVGYQRDKKTPKVKALMKAWSWKKYIPIVICARGARFAIIDGQQRWHAAVELGVEELPAILIVANSLEDEAERFLGANDVMAVSPVEKFRARLRTGEQLAHIIVRQVESCGFRVAGVNGSENNADPFCISAITTLETLYRGNRLVATLATINEAWGDQPHASMRTGSMMLGVAYALSHLRRHNVSREALTKVLRSTTPLKVSEKGRLRKSSMVVSSSSSAALCQVIVDTYNAKAKAPVPSWTQPMPGVPEKDGDW